MKVALNDVPLSHHNVPQNVHELKKKQFSGSTSTLSPLSLPAAI